MRIRGFFLLAACTCFWSCSTPPPPLPVSPPEAAPVAAPVEPVAEPTPVVPEPQPEPAPVPEPVIVANDGSAVTIEKYETSLAEIRKLVEKLNGIISQELIQEWKDHLDAIYLKKYSDPVFLAAVANDSSYLKQYGIRLKSIADYFKWVVVPSRSKVQVEDITFVDGERVEAFTIIKNEKVRLYQLKLYDKEWKISFW